MFLFRNIHVGSKIQPLSYPVRTAGKFHDKKRQRYDTDHSPAVSAEMMNTWICNSAPVTHFMALRLNKYSLNHTSAIKQV